METPSSSEKQKSMNLVTVWSPTKSANPDILKLYIYDLFNQGKGNQQIFKACGAPLPRNELVGYIAMIRQWGRENKKFK